MKKTFLSVAVLLAGLLCMPTTSYAGSSVPTYSHVNINEARLVLIKGPIRHQMSEEIVRDIYDISQENKGAIYYIINTNGGSLMAGNKIIQAMESSDTKSVCIVDRAAYSMGALILSHCNIAYIHKDASVMFHEGYLRIGGKLSEVLSFMDFERKKFDALNRETAKLLKMSVSKYIAKQKDEWWLTAKETVRVGLAKGIVMKLAYLIPEPPPQKRGFSLFGMNFDNSWSIEDGVYDLTYYPQYDTPVSSSGAQ